MNDTLSQTARDLIKAGLTKCSEQQQEIFKRMYSHQNTDLPINEVVDYMDEDKLDHALSQVERTVARNLGYV